MRITVLVANIYVHNPRLDAAVRLIADLNPTVAALSEGQRVDSIPGYRKVFSDIDHDATEVPVFLARHDATLDGWWVDQSTRDTGHKLAPDRWTTVARALKAGQRFAVLNTHMNAGITNASGAPMLNLTRVKEYQRHMSQLLTEAKHQRQQRWTPIVAGDFNYRPKGRLAQAETAALWFWSPHRAFPRIGLEYVSHGLDGLAYDPAVFKRHGIRVISAPGADHKWLLVHLDTREP